MDLKSYLIIYHIWFDAVLNHSLLNVLVYREVYPKVIYEMIRKYDSNERVKNTFYRKWGLRSFFLKKEKRDKGKEKRDKKSVLLLIISKPSQLKRIASPVLIHFHIQFDVDLFSEEFL